MKYEDGDSEELSEDEVEQHRVAEGRGEEVQGGSGGGACDDAVTCDGG